MIEPFSWVLLGAGLTLGLWAGIQAYRRRATNRALMLAAIVLQAAVLVQAVIALVGFAGDHPILEPVTFVAYALGLLLPLPLGFYLARIERTRWGSISLSFTAVVVAVMTLRLIQLWRGSFV